jgi:hypothetical protein
MRVILGLAPILFFFSVCGIAQTPATAGRPFYSADEYQRAHFLFNKLRADLDTAQSSTPAEVINRARADLNVLQSDWDSAVYDSRQMEETVVTVERAVDQSPRLRDRANLGDDASRLLDLRREYY